MLHSGIQSQSGSGQNIAPSFGERWRLGVLEETKTITLSWAGLESLGFGYDGTHIFTARMLWRFPCQLTVPRSHRLSSDDNGWTLPAGVGGSFQRQRYATGEGGRDVFGGRLGRRWKGESGPFGFNI